MEISIHPLRRERDVGNLLTVIPGSISIHSPHEGETCSSSILFSSMKFQSTHPEWDGTFGNEIIDFSQVFQSTRSVGSETRLDTIPLIADVISIHSPYEGETAFQARIVWFIRISIRSPVGGVRRRLR